MNSYRYEPRLRKRGMLAGFVVIWLVGSLITCVSSIAGDQQSGWAPGFGQRGLPTERAGVPPEQSGGGQTEGLSSRR
jgi:hypothetical protein